MEHKEYSWTFFIILCLLTSSCKSSQSLKKAAKDSQSFLAKQHNAIQNLAIDDCSHNIDSNDLRPHVLFGIREKARLEALGKHGDIPLLNARIAKIAGMTVKESGFNPLNVTEHNGGDTELKSPGELVALMSNGCDSRVCEIGKKHITVDKQTNYGTVQLSTDVVSNYANHMDFPGTFRKWAGNGTDFFDVSSTRGQQEYLTRCGYNGAQLPPSFFASMQALNDGNPNINFSSFIHQVQTNPRDRSNQLLFGAFMTSCPGLNIDLAYNLYYETRNGRYYFGSRGASSRCQPEIADALRENSNIVFSPQQLNIQPAHVDPVLVEQKQHQSRPTGYNYGRLGAT